LKIGRTKNAETKTINTTQKNKIFIASESVLALGINQSYLSVDKTKSNVPKKTKDAKTPNPSGGYILVKIR